jgi:hypothetical protein
VSRPRRSTILTAFVAIVLLACAGIWVRTFYADDRLWVEPWDQRGPRYEILHVQSSGDFISVYFSSATYSANLGRPLIGHMQFMGLRWAREEYKPRPQGATSWLWWDDYVDRPSTGGNQHVWRVQLRPWLPLLPASLLFALCLGAALRPYLFRQRMMRQGRCTRCGYDLRATPGQCPECGADPRDAAGALPT